LKISTAALREDEKMPLRKCWLALWLLASVAAPGLCLATADASARIPAGPVSLAAREHQLWNSAIHDSEFATMAHSASRTSCGAAQPPEALATPDPLLEQAEMHSKVSVSFIIGTDGRVHSPLILESAGPSEDRTVLNAVRFWRYRPARCNGIPTDAEAKVEFSNR
jgi:TonB family protein